MAIVAAIDGGSSQFGSIFQPERVRSSELYGSRVRTPAIEIRDSRTAIAKSDNQTTDSLLSPELQFFDMKKIVWVVPLLAAIPLLAVTPQFWEIRTYDDFRKGKLHESFADQR